MPYEKVEHRQRDVADQEQPTAQPQGKPPIAGIPFEQQVEALHPPAPLQAKRGSGTAAPARALEARSAGSGEKLPEPVQQKMEGALGADLSEVRIRQGSEASEIGARAYTRGSDVVFAPGQYDPGSRSGQELIGHELTHVVQQRQGRVPSPLQASGAVIHDDAALEREADRVGAAAARGESARGLSSGSAAARSDVVMRKADFGTHDPSKPLAADVGTHDPHWVRFSGNSWDPEPILNYIRNHVATDQELEAAVTEGPEAVIALLTRIEQLIGERETFMKQLVKRGETTPKACVEHQGDCAKVRQLIPAKKTKMDPNAGLMAQLGGQLGSEGLAYDDFLDLPVWLRTFREPWVPPESDRGTFGHMYKANGKSRPPDKEVKTQNYGNQTYDEYRDGLGDLQDSVPRDSPSWMHPNAQLTGPDLLAAFSRYKEREEAPKKWSAKQWKTYQGHNQQLMGLVGKVNTAFRAMKINKLEARAAYLAHAYHESSEFQFMTETEKFAPGDKKPYQPKGKDAGLNMTWLRDAEVDNKVAYRKPDGTVGELNLVGYKEGQSVNPTGDWQESFLGRGPLQVTHKHGYAQVLAVLESRLEELEKLPVGTPERQDIKLLSEALVAIKKDPREAASHKYAFLFSAAYMKRPGGKGGTGRPHDQRMAKHNFLSFMGNHASVPDVAQKKKDQYDIALDVLKKRNEAAKKAAAEQG